MFHLIILVVVLSCAMCGVSAVGALEIAEQNEAAIRDLKIQLADVERSVNATLEKFRSLGRRIIEEGWALDEPEESFMPFDVNTFGENILRIVEAMARAEHNRLWSLRLNGRPYFGNVALPPGCEPHKTADWAKNHWTFNSTDAAKLVYDRIDNAHSSFVGESEWGPVDLFDDYECGIFDDYSARCYHDQAFTIQAEWECGKDFRFAQPVWVHTVECMMGEHFTNGKCRDGPCHCGT